MVRLASDVTGSGKVGTPWARMHRAYRSAAASSAWLGGCGELPAFRRGKHEMVKVAVVHLTC
jgi:hypothetical protein